MFLRRYERRAGGRRRTYWALVESLRTGRGSRQRIVAYLGELKPSEQSGWAQLGHKLSGKQKLERSLFDPPHDQRSPQDEAVLVRLRGVRLERLRDFGDVWMAWGLWRLLGLDVLLEQVTTAGREEVRRPLVAAILTIVRFCQPQSELHIESTWYRATALEDLLGVPVEKPLETMHPVDGRASGRFGSPKTSWKSAPSGIRSSTASWPTSSCASWPTCCGRHSPSGCADRAWATHRGRCWKSWRKSKAATSCCRPKPSRASTTQRFACAASPSPTRPRKFCSIDSESPSPAGSAALTTSYKCSETTAPKMNLSPCSTAPPHPQLRNLG